MKMRRRVKSRGESNERLKKTECEKKKDEKMIITTRKYMSTST